jgi:hypothetical protein
MNKVRIVTENKASGLRFSFVIDQGSTLLVPHCQLILKNSGYDPEGMEVKAMELISENLMQKIFKPEEAARIINIENLGCINGDSGFTFKGVHGLLDTTCSIHGITIEVEDGEN